MPFLFKILGIVIGIIIWKTVLGSFRKANRAMHDDSYDRDEDGPVPAAQLDHDEQWRQAAQQISCTFDPGKDPHGNGATITGRFSGHAVTVKRFGRNYVRYFVGLRRFPGIPVCVVRDMETIAARILDGHPVFSSRMFFPSGEPLFFCSSESEEAFDRFLAVPSNRSAVLNLVHLFPSCMFNPEGVSVRLRASTPDVSVLDQMITIADALENPSQTPMPDLTVPQKKGLLTVPADFSPAAEVEANEVNITKRFAPIEAGAARKTSKILRQKEEDNLSRKTTVIRISPEAKRMQSSDTLKASVVRNTSETTVSAAPEPAANAPISAQKTAAASGNSLSVESVCAALFAKPFPGTEERAAFDAMKGRRVCWSGQLLTVLPFSMDFVFGSRKGVKATFIIYRMTQSQFGAPVPIKAVAAFPPELQRSLESGRGKEVTFEGELLKFEPFAHELYLQDASLKS